MFEIGVDICLLINISIKIPVNNDIIDAITKESITVSYIFRTLFLSAKDINTQF